MYIDKINNLFFYIIEVELDHRFGEPIEVYFEVTRPFLFMIEDITMDTIVFVGQVMNPLSQGSPVVSIPPVKTKTPMKCKFIIYNFKNDQL